MLDRINHLPTFMPVTCQLMTQTRHKKKPGRIAAPELAGRPGPARPQQTGEQHNRQHGRTGIEQNIEHERSDEYHSLITIAVARPAQAKAAWPGRR